MSDLSDKDTIHEAARRGDLDAVRRFVEMQGADAVEQKDKDGNTPLVVAALAGVGINTTRKTVNPVVVLRYLISKKANVEAIVGDGTYSTFPDYIYIGCTALVIVSRCGNHEAVKMLLEDGGANVNSSSSQNGYTALAAATSRPGGLCVVPTLLHHGAKVNNPIRKTGFPTVPLLNVLALKDASNVVQLLLERGADVKVKDDRGNAVMYLAVERSNVHVANMRLLLEYGAELNPHNPKNPHWNPFLKVVRLKNAAALQVLLNHDANIDVMVGDGTILHEARDVETLGILLDHCRSTMTEEAFNSFLLHKNACKYIALHTKRTVELAQLLIEQPRRQDGQLLPACEAQLQWWRGVTAGWPSSVVAYVKSFQSLVLSIPDDVKAFASSSATKRQKVTRIAVKPNPELSRFQRSVAQEAFALIMTTTDLPDCLALVILGYLTPLDVMKRSGKAAPTLHCCRAVPPVFGVL